MCRCMEQGHSDTAVAEQNVHNLIMIRVPQAMSHHQLRQAACRPLPDSILPSCHMAGLVSHVSGNANACQVSPFRVPMLACQDARPCVSCDTMQLADTYNDAACTPARHSAQHRSGMCLLRNDAACSPATHTRLTSAGSSHVSSACVSYMA